MRKLAVDGGVEKHQQVVLQAHHQHLAFGIAETDIVFDQLRAVVGDHQADEQHAGKRHAARRHALHGGLDDLAHGAVHHFGRHDRRGRIGAHAAGVRACVALADALVVLRRAEGDGRPAVAQAEEARFLAFQEPFHHDLGAVLVEACIDRRKRLVDGGGDRHPLSRRQPVRLDDDGRALFLHIGPGGVRVGESPVGGRGDGEFRAQVLGEAFRPFELGGCLRRPEDADTGGPQVISDARHQRSLRPDDDQIDVLLAAEGGDRAVIGNVERDDRRLLGDAGIAGRGIERRQQRRCRQFPGQRMLTSAGAEKKNVHEGSHC